MDRFHYRDGALFAEDVPVSDIAAQFGTPCFVYSKATLIRHFHAYADSLTDIPHLICYGMKANSNLAVLQILAQEGAGFDIVSVGELERVIKAGGEPSKVVFSGVGKQGLEMRRAPPAEMHKSRRHRAKQPTLREHLTHGVDRRRHLAQHLQDARGIVPPFQRVLELPEVKHHIPQVIRSRLLARSAN